jgi:hypothetical protein
MNHIDIDEEVKQQRAFQRLGTDHPQCLLCGESDYRCLELHHIAGRAFDEQTVIYCRNCHRKLSDSTANTAMPMNPPVMEQIGQFLLGLAEFLLALIERLHEFGHALLDGAAYCPRPWGVLPEVNQ